MQTIRKNTLFEVLFKVTNFFIKYNWAIIMTMSLIAFLTPTPFLWIVKYTGLLLSIAMFGMGSTINSRDFYEIFKRPRDVILGFILQFSIMPIIAWFLAVTFKLPQDLAVGVILVGCCPGGTASNIITHIAKGDVALSVAMTITSTLFAPIITPIWIYFLANKWVDVSFLAMFKTVITIILIPVLLGIGINHYANVSKNSKFESSFNDIKKILPLISSVAVIMLISGIVAANSDKIFKSGFLVLVVVIIHNLLGILFGLIVSKLFKVSYEKSTAISIEVGMQNSGLAISLAALNFAANPLATLPGAIFSVWHNLSGSLYAGFRRKKVKLEGY